MFAAIYKKRIFQMLYHLDMNHENKINEEKFKNAILTTSFENMKKSEQKGEFNENVT